MPPITPAAASWHPTPWWEGDNVIPAGVNLNYKLNDANSIVGAASYTSLTSGHELLGEKDVSFHNETNFNLGWKNQDGLLKNLSTTVGWNLIHGGLLGNFAKYDYSGIYGNDSLGRRHAHSVAQEFYLNLNYDVCKNWFAGVTTSYGFQGMTGWWFQPYVGYKATICPATDIVLTAGMSATAGYFDSKSAFMANGSQAWWVKVELPIKGGRGKPRRGAFRQLQLGRQRRPEGQQAVRGRLEALQELRRGSRGQPCLFLLSLTA